ncbi:MAG: A/G-specific adenine glycosylase [Alistipes sp.]|nr:A/G-specific adenine glycosylase [Alistipes sp.]
MKTWLTEQLQSWYGDHARTLPWRETREGYRIWLSEIILQQTRVEQGMAYYLRFVERFPTVRDLAEASEDEVLKLWQGLGYYSRARNLHAAARSIVKDHNGIFPSTYDEIRSLRGVGPYTAAAIASLAYDLPYAVVDGNVYRVLARLFDIETPIDTTLGQRTFAALAQELIPTDQAAAHNQAMMEFGALHCTPTSPRCDCCPLSERCQALAHRTVAERPTKQGRTKIRDRYLHYLHLTDGRHTLLHRRSEGDIWAGLYEFPLIETASACDFLELCKTDSFKALLGGSTYTLRQTTPMAIHQLSHQRLHATFYLLEMSELPTAEGVIAVPLDELDRYAIPRLIERYLLQ